MVVTAAAVPEVAVAADAAAAVPEVAVASGSVVADAADAAAAVPEVAASADEGHDCRIVQSTSELPSVSMQLLALEPKVADA